MESAHSRHSHHHKEKQSFSRWIRHNWKFLLVVILMIIFLLAFFIDRKTKKIDNFDEQNETIEVNQNNYDAIITVIDGEGESTFTDVWGELIQEGYPICSDLVTDYVGTKGHMDWDTIEALNNVGVEFVFHSSKHHEYNSMSEDEIFKDFEYGKSEMQKHGLKSDFVVWISGTEKQICESGSNYFSGGFAEYNSTSTIDGNKGDPMAINVVIGYSNDNYYQIDDLISLINQTKQNNGWLVIFTRNNSPKMDSTQIDIYRQAFEYAKEHNVAVVTASEGYDLYYGNKLGNH